MQKRAWNGSTEEWIKERHYTKDEIDGKLDEILQDSVSATVLPVTITYTDNTTQTVNIYVRI